MWACSRCGRSGSRGLARLAGLLALTTALASCAAAKELILGISYGPVPLLSPEGVGRMTQDDWMADEAVTMWGRGGRGDLQIMKRLGANMVRLYGNNPGNDHTNFLDAAWAERLQVAAGMSDWPYYQMVPGRCLDTGFDCFEQVKGLYVQNLQKGFLTADNKYHPALKYMNILNEPDLKMPPTTTTGDEEGPRQMCRAIISAFDAMLEAEKEVQVTGPLINFTATFSYAICAACTEYPSSPALGQMAQLDDAMRNPEKYGYTPKHDITLAYLQRFTHSFNTANPATDLEVQFLTDYAVKMPSTPVYIGEYHRPHADQIADLSMIAEVAKRNPLFLGISYFEYQVAYWKGGSEMDFGMFGLEGTVLASMPYSGQEYSINCLAPQPSAETGMSLPEALAQVYGGPGVDSSTFCAANPWGVPLDQAGYSSIAAQRSPEQMHRFAQRVVEHLGATVRDDSSPSFQSFVRKYAAPGADFMQMASELGGGPTWMEADTRARCVADRTAHPAVVGTAIAWVCANAKSFSCAAVPRACVNNTYRTADYLFSRYYEEAGPQADPLRNCNFQGAAMFAPSQVYMMGTGSSQCVEGASSLPELATNTGSARPLAVVLPQTTTTTTTTFVATQQPVHGPPVGGGDAWSSRAMDMLENKNTTTAQPTIESFLAMSGAPSLVPRLLQQLCLLPLLVAALVT